MAPSAFPADAEEGLASNIPVYSFYSNCHTVILNNLSWDQPEWIIRWNEFETPWLHLLTHSKFFCILVWRLIRLCWTSIKFCNILIIQLTTKMKICYFCTSRNDIWLRSHAVSMVFISYFIEFLFCIVDDIRCITVPNMKTIQLWERHNDRDTAKWVK